MKTPCMTLFDSFAVLLMSVMTAAPNISCADKAPFSYGTGNLMVVV